MLLLENSSEQGDSYFRKAGVRHNVVNGGKAKMVFVELELKHGA